MNRLTTTDVDESSRPGTPLFNPIGKFRSPPVTEPSAGDEITWEMATGNQLPADEASRQASAVHHAVLMGETSTHLIFHRDDPQSPMLYVVATPSLTERPVAGWLGKQEVKVVTLSSLPERSAGTVLDAYAAQLPAETAARIRELDEMPYDAEGGEEPMNPGSVECFLKCFTNMPRTEKLPELSASHSGTLYATWLPEPGTRVTAEFCPSGGTIWVALSGAKRDPESWEVSIEDVLLRKSLLPIPGII